jgi:hypothetical protein
VADRVYVNGTLAAITLATTTGTIGFCDYISPTNVLYLFMCDGTNAYTLNASFVWATITSATGLPSPHIPTPVYLDGYVFLAKSGTQDIYNSNLGDPTTWTAGDFISAEMYGDILVALARNNQYIYAIGKQSIEYFYDAANPTGTPLARHESAVQQFGSPFINSIVQTEKEVILVGSTSNGALTVWLIDGFNAEHVISPTVEEVLSQAGSVTSCEVFGSVFRLLGQKYYLISIVSSAGGFSNRTFVWSFDTKLWIEWFNYNMTATFPCKFITGGNDGWGLAAAPITCDNTTGQMYYLQTILAADGSTPNPISAEVITEKFDFNTINRKSMSRLTLIGDPPDKTTANRYSISISWSDDDYLTWSTARTLSFTTDLPSIHQLGSFRRRAFKLTYTPSLVSSTAPLALRLSSMEVDINKGVK